MKYFFILGNNPTLSIAEISAVFELNNVADRTGQCPAPTLMENVLILETNQKFDAQDLIKKLGGTIKIGEIADDAVETRQCLVSESFPSDDNQTRHCLVSTDDYINEIKKIIETKIKNETPTAKYNFGISNYTNRNINTKIIGMELKTWLKEKNISCRFVVSQEKTLSSVVVEQNKLLKSGVEIVILPEGKLGYTLAVQPFKELSFRDYGRPARDDLSGMLPPKLAQIMINLAVAPFIKGGEGIPSDDFVILDPFCGSGTILTEAMLMGFQNLIGSDLSRKAINDTEKNIDWVQKKFLTTNSQIPNIQLHNISAPQLSQKIQPNSIDLIATEPYLGPQRGKIDLPKIIGELTALYSAGLKEFFKVLKPGGRVVMVWPVWEDKFFLNPNLNGFKIAKSIPESLRNNPAIKLTARQTIIYGRPGQKVWREIVVLTK